VDRLIGIGHRTPRRPERSIMREIEMVFNSGPDERNPMGHESDFSP
jgi:hypothetical protein